MIQARAPKHGEVAAHAVVSAGKTTDIGAVRLRAGGTVRGTVVDGAGEPVAGASVRLETGTPRARSNSIAQTDGAGAFEIAGVPPGQFHVTARHPAFAPGRAPAEIKSETDTVDVRVVLPRGGRVEGVARRRDGQPFAGAQVIVIAGPEPLGWSPGGSRVTVADDGSFAVEHAAAGRARLLLLVPATTSRRAGSPVDPPARGRGARRRDDAARHHLARGARERTRDARRRPGPGRHGDSPAPAVRQRLLRRGPGGGRARGWPAAARRRDPRGRQLRAAGVRARGVPGDAPHAGGRDRARCGRRPRRPTGPASCVEVPDVPAFSLDFVIGASPVSGIVVDADTGQPVARALGETSSAPAASATRRRARTAASASRSSPPRDGSSRARRATPRPRRSSRSARPEPRTCASSCDRARSSADASRTAPAGPGATSRSVRRLEGAEGSGLRGFAVSLPDGRFRMTGLREGVFSLVAGSEALGLGLRRGVLAGTSEAVLTIRPAARANVRVVDAAGAPVARAFVRVVTCGGLPIALPVANGPTDGSGVATVALPEGACVLEARGEAGVGRTTIDARAGAQVSTEIVLERPKPPVKPPSP